MSTTPKKNGSVSSERGAPAPPITVEDFDDDDVVILPPLPPDGGYGWVVMVAAMLCSVIVDGLCFSFGIFFTEFINDFESSKAKTSFVGSLVPGMYLGMGPIASALSNKYGFRVVTMFGGVVAGISFFASTFSPTINWLIFIYGFCGGFGLGMAYLPSIGAVSFYFEKRRALATGVTVCGSGIGAFVFAPLSNWLLAYYGGWRPAYHIISGIVLNIAVLGALFRPLKARVIRKHKRQTGEAQTVSTKGTIMDRMIAEKQKRNRTISDSSLDGAVITKGNNIEKSNTDLHLKPIGENEHDDNANNGAALLPEPRSRTSSVLHYHGSSVHIAGGSQQDLHKRVMAEVARPMYKQDIMYTGSVKNLNEYKSQPDRETYIRSHTSLPAIDESKKQTCGAKMAPAIHVIKEMFDISLLRSIMFLVVCLSSFLSMFGFFTPFFFVTTYAVAQGIDNDKATMLISLLGVFNTVSRIATGFFSDKPWANPLIIHNVALICAGVATCFAPMFVNFPLLVIYCGIFGCCIAAYICIRSILLVDLLGLEKLNNAFGLFLFCQGVASLIGSPLAGALFDYSNSFALSFLVGGVSIALAGIVTIPVRYIKRWEDKRHAKKNGDATRYSEVKVNGD